VALSDESLVVAFTKGFHAGEVTGRSDHVERIREALEQVFGRKLRLETEVRDERPETQNPEGNGEEGSNTSAVELVRKGLSAEVVEEVRSS
jgi:hypothetical protein